MKVAKGHRVVSQEITSPTESTAGRTFYLGSPSSAVRSRLYEKGLHPDAHLEKIPTDVVRLEYQIRPSSSQKEALALMPLTDCIAASAWGKDLAERAQLCPGEQWNPTGGWTRGSFEKTVQSMVRQYGKCLTQIIQNTRGDSDEFLRYIEEAIRINKR